MSKQKNGREDWEFIAKEKYRKKPKTCELELEIISAYNQLEPDISYGVRIDDLWKQTQNISPDISFKDFEQVLLKWIHTFITDVDPSVGVSLKEQKIIYDPHVYQGTYFHYIKIKKNVQDWLKEKCIL